MGLSVASLNPVSNATTYVAPKQQSYTVANESEISSAYRESVANTSTPQGVRGPAPVQYATSRYNVGSLESLSANRRMNRAYNNIAAGFNGVNTSYDRNSQASPYDVVGDSFDAFA